MTCFVRNWASDQLEAWLTFMLRFLPSLTVITIIIVVEVFKTKSVSVSHFYNKCGTILIVDINYIQ
jgi:hypothetical protein